MIRIGVLCPSEIALRRFMPALSLCDSFSFVGIAYASPAEWFGDQLTATAPEKVEKQQQIEQEKAREFVATYGGQLFDSYQELLSSDQIDAVYLPLPPGLHYRWAKAALLHQKHLMVEKPATISLSDTRKLLKIAADRQLAVHENYMFAFHRQLQTLDEIIASGEIGEVRLHRLAFGFPRRALQDFRYQKALGGGALLDCGGYTLKYADRLLGHTARLTAATSNHLAGFDVDVYGSGTLINDQGVTVQIAFGMDHQYKCELEVWGSAGTLLTGRVLTAPANFTPTATIVKGGESRTIDLPSDDAFQKSIRHFECCVNNSADRKNTYLAIERQAGLVNQFMKLAERTSK